MKFYSSETMRQHAQDLTKELEVKQIPEALRYFIINMNKGTTSLPMTDQAYRIPRQWASTGLLDLHDVVQEFYVALIVAWNRVDWAFINASDEPKARLWKYLKKSMILDVRHQINYKKDGVKITKETLWENKGEKRDDFFTSSMDNYWFWVNDEILNMIDDSKMTTWETEILHEGLQDVMRVKLSDTERLILEMFYGINEPNDKPKSQGKIAEYFGRTLKWVQINKFRAIKKLQKDEVKQYLDNFVDFE